MDKPSVVSPAARGITLGEILNEAGVHRDSIVRVTGSAGLAALLWFARHGYRQVGYVRPAGHLASEGDLLLVPQTCDVETLEVLLSHGPCVRPGGVLIVQTPEPVAGAADGPVHALLIRRGYDIERCLHGRHRELHVARRHASMALAA